MIVTLMNLSVFSIFVTIITGHMHAVDQPPPKWVQQIVWGILARIVCMAGEPPATGLSANGRGETELTVRPIATPDPSPPTAARILPSDGEATNYMAAIVHELECIDRVLRAWDQRLATKANAEEIRRTWRRTATVVDRFLMLIFALIMAITLVVCLSMATAE